MDYYLSIIIPAYNEQHRIRNTLERIYCYIMENNINAEIIIVDDGSDDNTFTIAESFSKESNCIRVFRNEKNKGKGFSVRRGTLAAKGKHILFTDADNSTPIQELTKLLPYVSDGQYDIAIGSRFLKESVIKISQPWFRKKSGKILNFFVKLFLYRDFEDTQCGFKCFSRQAAQSIFTLSNLNGFSFDIEILAIAKLKGYRIKEVPIVWADNSYSRVNTIIDGFKIFLDILQIRNNLYRKAYVCIGD